MKLRNALVVANNCPAMEITAQSQKQLRGAYTFKTLGISLTPLEYHSNLFEYTRVHKFHTHQLKTHSNLFECSPHNPSNAHTKT